MSWISTLNAWQWAVLGAVPALILLMYFLKLRREVVEVPSTYLWSRTIEDLHVNSLLQRLRRSVLLLLQLLAVLLAVLALLRPGVRGESTSQSRLVFMIDRSASMQATDVSDDASRFEMARRLIAERIDAMQDSESAMLIAFDSRSEVMQTFTTDRRRLRESLDRIEVSDRTTDLLSALRAADGLSGAASTTDVESDIDSEETTNATTNATDDEPPPAKRIEPALLLLYSDGGFPSVAEVELNHLVPQFVAVGSATPNNLAVTAFSAERNPDRPSELQTFATISNFGNSRAAATATLSIGGQFADAAAVDLEPGEQTGVSFKLENEAAVTMTMKLDIDDDLQLDNEAFAGLAPAHTVTILLATSGNKPLELALGTLKAGKICEVEIVPPSYLESDAYKSRASSAGVDLMIFDRCSPPVMPATNTFSIGSLPTTVGWEWASEAQPIVLIDADRTHPLMRYVEMLQLLVYRGRALTGPAGTTELLGADVGTVLAIAPRDGYQDLVLGFEVVSQADDGTLQVNTNWYAERSWPVFVLNVLKFLAGAAEGSAAISYQPGETVRLRVETATSLLEVTRDGDTKSTTVTLDSGSSAEFTATERLGNYRVQAKDRLADLFTVNLFDRRESSLATSDEVSIGYQTIAATTAVAQQRHEYWRWLLIVMLGILVTEWWIYAKRLG